MNEASGEHNSDFGRPDPRIGQRIGRYCIKSVIATGGMGTVYLAEQDQPRREVALKVIRPEFASRTGLRRFEIEAELLAKLRHSNVAHVYEAGLHEEQGAAGAVRLPYFAMEFLDGARPITAYAIEQQLGTKDRLRLFVQVCDAVHHGHQKGVIHRDLKPANILVDRAGQVKVIDFGVARATDGDLMVTTVGSGLNSMIGTPQYMSPEQCKGDPQEVDVRSDVYSLGIVLYELVCGRKPYDFGTVYEAVQVICEMEPVAPSGVNRALRGDVDAMVLTALAKDPAKRYQSAGELAADIRRHLNCEPITVRPPTRWARAVRWAGRHPMLTTAGLASVVGIAIILAAMGLVWFAKNQPHELVVSWNGGRVGGAAREVRLLSLGGHRMRSWTMSEGNMLQFAHPTLIERSPELGGGRLAVIGYGRHEDATVSGAVVAYDVDDDIWNPDWIGRIKPGEPVPQSLTPGIERVNRPEDFVCCSGAVLDIFAESDGPEIVAVFVYGLFSQCILRIYDLRGEVLYEVWHDGNINSFHWLADEGLLVLGGLNGVSTKGELSLCGTATAEDACEERHPPIICAIRPKLGRILHDKYIGVTAGAEDWDAEWYLTFLPSVSSVIVTPPWTGDARRCVGLSVGIAAPVKGWFNLAIDQDGNEIPGTRQRDSTYLAQQDKLPGVSTFELVPFVEILATEGKKPSGRASNSLDRKRSGGP